MKHVQLFSLILLLSSVTAFAAESPKKETKGSTQSSWTTELSPITIKIGELLTSSEPVRVMVMGEVKTNITVIKDIFEQNTLLQLINEWETKLLNRYGQNPNLSILERTYLREIMKEQSFSASGAVTQRQAIELGQLSGATHVIYTSYYKIHYPNQPVQDQRRDKLVELQTGKVISSQWVDTSY